MKKIASAATSTRSSRSPLPAMTLEDVYAAPGHLIRRAQQIAVAVFHEEFEGWDVTPVQYAALIAIRDRPGMDQRTLVKFVAIDRSTVGTMLKGLEGRRLISRATPKNDQRTKQLFIRPEGARLLDETRENIARVQERILAPLGKEQRAFMQSLAKLVQLNNDLSRAPLRAAK
ncbi:MarR family winged helix-turn-helix transcriptional regulator [Rhodoplanes sp. Z2-YC6860]|uniref:MarR family winged helix-turn-helix transcriptional regulator n=1 Tax=Rhodoplanes sp. Z2-YC6860 TaxID=674703 RepID=UPI001F03079A|nr:MarR family transcriptional regulator [Rhodoplanes sp. Z2-YC6860]